MQFRKRPGARQLGLMCAPFLLVLAAACSADPGQGRELTYGLTLAPTGIDPHINASVELGIPLSSVYDTLVFQDPSTGAYVPGLATDWSISPDGLTYSFVLREQVVFHDGTRFDAEAVKANIDYVLDPDHRSQKAAAMLGPLNEVEVLGSYEVAFHLDRPYAPMLDSLSQVYLGMASPSALETWGPSEYQFNQVGTGPFRFIEYLPNDRLVLERNPDYAWAPEIYRREAPAIDRIVFRFYEDPATRALALEGGQVDIMGELPHREADRLAESSEFRVDPVLIPGQPLQLIFNTERAPTDDPRVRQALVLGVDRSRIVDTVFGESSPVAGGPLSASTFGFAAEPTFPSYDPVAAAELLEQVGWTHSDGGNRRRGDAELQLELVVPSWGSNPEVGQLVAAAWEQLGAEVTLTVAPGFGPLIDARTQGEYNAIGMNSFGTDPDLLRPFYVSEGFFNWSGYRDPKLDSLLASAAESFASPDQREQLYQEFAEYVLDLWLILPVRDYVNLVGSSQRVEGLRFSPQGWFPYLNDLELRP
ncbi:MAG: ABC transporter substrate-binding protein [Anaerolineae bacterium]|nr:MAG: ABC transporter substrate-binding protein [Anaerolineae bacterium]